MTRFRLAAALAGAVSVLALAACGDANGAAPAPEPDIVSLQEAPTGQLPTGVTPTVYRLNLVTDPSAVGFTGDVEIDVTLDAPHSRIWLHALGTNVINAFARLPDGREVPATFTGDQAEGGVSRLDFESALPAGQVTLVMDYEAPYNLALAGLYKVTQNGNDYLASQMQSIDARRMVPSFDEPRFKTVWEVTVTAPEGLKVVTNGAEVEASPAEDGMVTHSFAPTRPIATYLLGLIVGPYDESDSPPIEPPSQIRSDAVPLRGFAAEGKGEQLSTALEMTHPILKWQEDYFGVPYPYGKLDIVAAPDFAWGAMENAGVIIYREAALLLNERSTLTQQRGVYTTHAHELAHQWFGNLVTPKWWNDIWLNESFATWMAYKTLNAVDPAGEWNLNPIAAGLGAMRADSLSSARQIRNPIANNADIEDAFDAITYSKGGSVLNMFESYLGEEKFRAGIRTHMTRFQDGVADVDDFMQSLAEGSGHEGVVESFRSFVLQPGIPMLDVTVQCNASGGALMRVSQNRYAPLGSEIDQKGTRWQIPFTARISYGETSETRNWMLSGNGLAADLQQCPDYVMPNAGGAGYWRFALDSAYGEKLSANFNELSAGEQMVYLDSLVAGFEAGSVSAEALLAGLEASTNGSAAAISQPFAALSSYHARLSPEARPAFSSWIERTYGPVATRLQARPEETLTVREQLLKESVGGLLTSIGDRPAAKARLQAAAEAYIGFEKKADPKALKPQEVSQAIAAGLSAHGQPFADAALEFALASENQPERAAILRSLADNGEADIVAGLLRRLPDLEVTSSETFTILGGALNNSSTAARAGGDFAAVWAAFEENFDGILAKLPEVRKPQVSNFTAAFCSTAEVEQASAFLRSKAGAITGYERGLAQGTERAKLCEALAAQQIPKLANALAAR